jgi:hypothetical protein
MIQNDIMKKWFNEEPNEQMPDDFTGKVMQRVMSEWTLNPIKYQPIISRRGWWNLGLITLLLTGLLVALYSFLPEGSLHPTQPNTIYGFELSELIKPIGNFFEKLNNISPAVVIGALAIVALWFFDQLFIRTVRR